jgi:hypothetical protein
MELQLARSWLVISHEIMGVGAIGGFIWQLSGVAPTITVAPTPIIITIAGSYQSLWI